MKKTTLPKSIAAIMGLLIVIGVGCSKESNETQTYQVCNEFDLKICNSIKGFMQKVGYQNQNPMFKSMENIDADSALWYLESTFNYCYGFPNEFYRKFEVDTIGFTLELTNDGKVNMTMLANKFQQMILEITTVYQSVDFEEKGLSMINLQDATVSDEEIAFTVNVVTGEKDTPPQIVISGPFGEGDDWWYGEMEGRCDEFLMDSDAAKQLMLAMNATLPEPGSTFFVIDPISIVREGGKPNVRRENDPNPPDNLYDYYLFYGTEEIGTVELCLYRNDMNNYYSFLRHLLLVKIPNQELNSMYSLINVVDMIGNWRFTPPPNVVSEYFHNGTFRYGIKIHYIAEPYYPIELD
ncbi:MAG TPA: hypothetical protein PK915_10710 [Bacteroidales bacterium]|nr:hypothetical protein [Bacteroidales bacterium]